jgi:hypothetical protein
MEQLPSAAIAAMADLLARFPEELGQGAWIFTERGSAGDLRCVRGWRCPVMALSRHGLLHWC